MKEEICPICKGSGKLESPYKKYRDFREARKQMVKDLIRLGYSYRQVQKFVGFGSTRSISMIIKNKK